MSDKTPGRPGRGHEQEKSERLLHEATQGSIVLPMKTQSVDITSHAGGRPNTGGTAKADSSQAGSTSSGTD